MTWNTPSCYSQTAKWATGPPAAVRTGIWENSDSFSVLGEAIFWQPPHYKMIDHQQWLLWKSFVPHVTDRNRANSVWLANKCSIMIILVSGITSTTVLQFATTSLGSKWLTLGNLTGKSLCPDSLLCSSRRRWVPSGTSKMYGYASSVISRVSSGPCTWGQWHVYFALSKKTECSHALHLQPFNWCAPQQWSWRVWTSAFPPSRRSS